MYIDLWLEFYGSEVTSVVDWHTSLVCSQTEHIVPPIDLQLIMSDIWALVFDFVFISVYSRKGCRHIEGSQYVWHTVFSLSK